MRILVTGGPKGQVLQALSERGLLAGHEIVALGRPEIDLSSDRVSIFTAIAASSPDAVVSAAAYTAVDRAEDEPDLAYAINESGARAVAQSANELGLPLVHLSTDYVFNGSKKSPYTENDPTDPISVYGASKRAGEEAVLSAHSDCAVLRTSWVYSPYGSNFVRAMLHLAESRDEVSVVADQHGNPTSAFDIADAVIEILVQLRANPDARLRGIFHMTGRGEASWSEFAEAIFSVSGSMGGPTASVRSITTSDYPTKARRPANSRLDNSKLMQTFGLHLPDWQRSLERVVALLVSHQNGNNKDSDR